MIDWVSIVRHSHRRFSNYVYGVPNKVRRRRKPIKKQVENGKNKTPHSSDCSCCWSDKVQVMIKYLQTCKKKWKWISQKCSIFLTIHIIQNYIPKNHEWQAVGLVIKL